ncbi:MAG: sulfatase [Planctomyces sp.]|nr:sulfatase [Planctomyces sp.]
MDQSRSQLSGQGRQLLDRRRFLSDSATALGSIALLDLLAGDQLLADSPEINPARPFAPRKPHFPAKAKRVVVIFCAGAVSQLETWDYKPELIRQDGQPLKGGPAVTFQGPAGDLARPQYKFRQRGETGKWVSDMIPHLAELTDDIAFVHSLTSKSNTHGPAENFLSTGTPLDGFPSLGSWVTYAMGTENQNLPAYVAIPDPRGVPQNGSNNWGPGFLPAAFQGTTLSSKKPIRHLSAPAMSSESDQAARSLLQRMNKRHQEQHPGDSKLSARIASYELAARMQLSVPEITDLSSEPAHILKSYGADDESNPTRAAFARNCILARRMIESGVRFVQLFNGAYASGGRLNWDGHNKLKEQYDEHATILDQPTAAMIKDMKARGLLEDTLVVWCTEFGRMPFFQKGSKGRDHNPDGFTCWMTGAGVKPGVSHGMTDELGQKAVEHVHPLYDFNATILHLLGFDHERLTFRHNGIDRRLTNVEGHVIQEILS